MQWMQCGGTSTTRLARRPGRWGEKMDAVRPPCIHCIRTRRLLSPRISPDHSLATHGLSMHLVPLHTPMRPYAPQCTPMRAYMRVSICDLRLRSTGAPSQAGRPRQAPCVSMRSPSGNQSVT